MKKITVYEIVVERLVYEESWETTPLTGIKPFLKEKDAKEFIQRASREDGSRYYYLQMKASEMGGRLSYRVKEMDMFESIEEYDQEVKKEKQAKLETLQKVIADSEDEME